MLSVDFVACYASTFVYCVHTSMCCVVWQLKLKVLTWMMEMRRKTLFHGLHQTWALAALGLEGQFGPVAGTKQWMAQAGGASPIQSSKF